MARPIGINSAEASNGYKTNVYAPDIFIENTVMIKDHDEITVTIGEDQ